jgi:hypothetical protein
MTKLQPPYDLIDSIGESYKLFLESVLRKAHQSGAAIHHLMEVARNDIAALNKFGEDEAVKLEKSIKRDLIDPARRVQGCARERAVHDWGDSRSEEKSCARQTSCQART